jgi:hypothetical protein
MQSKDLKSMSKEPIKNGSNRSSNGRFVAGNTASVGKGRPKGVKSIPDILRKIGEEEGTKDGIPKLEVVMRMVYSYALEGRSWAVQFIADRMEGRPAQKIETTTKERPIGFELNEI